jgi:hypothetical protein
VASAPKKKIYAYRVGVGFAVLFIFSVVGLYIGIPTLGEEKYQGAAVHSDLDSASSTEIEIINERKATHVATPEVVKGIYMTSCVAATPSLRNNLVKLIDDTEINSVVIDIKSYDGYISFMPKSEELKRAVGGCFVADLQDFIDELHLHHIYVIGRLASFQDGRMVKQKPELAVKKASATSTVWRDYKGIPWIDASARPHWEYLVAVAREAHDVGFDEIQFDYIRFPSDGNMKDIYYPWSGAKNKSEVMKSFFEYVHNELSPQGITISADLFGMTTTNFDDLNIGQVLEYALPNFNYISPMVYPSHYPNSFLGLGNPNAHVYEVVKYSMDRAVERAVSTTTRIVLPDARIGTSTPALYEKPAFDRNKLRPWLQDNNYPVTYTAEMVRAQIQANYDAGLDSWLLWNAANRYTKAALEAPEAIDLQ